MGHLMCIQVAFLAEFSSTHNTFIWFSSGMYSHVHRNVTSGGKYLATYAASVSVKRNIEALVHCCLDTIVARPFPSFRVPVGACITA